MAASTPAESENSSMMTNENEPDNQEAIAETKFGPWAPGITPGLVKEFEAAYGSLLEVLTIDESTNSVDAEVGNSFAWPG